MRILVAGLGAIGQRHARNLRTLLGDELDLLAYRQRRLPYVVTDTLERDTARIVEAELALSVHGDLDGAFEHGVDAVFVCTPSSQHLGIAQQAAQAGCHLFIEKPLSQTLEGVDVLQRSVAEQGLQALVGCQWRFHPHVCWLREMVQAGAFGRIHHAEIEYEEYLPDWHPYEDYRTSYAARAEMGGGVVLTQIHDYDLVWWIFGPAHQVTASGGHLSSLEIDVEDTVEARVECRHGTVSVRQCFASRRCRRSISMCTDRGRIALDLLASRVDADAQVETPPALPGFQRNDLFLAEARHFLACIGGREESRIPLADGVAVLELALAVKTSMATGNPVMLA